MLRRAPLPTATTTEGYAAGTAAAAFPCPPSPPSGLSTRQCSTCNGTDKVEASLMVITCSSRLFAYSRTICTLVWYKYCRQRVMLAGKTHLVHCHKIIRPKGITRVLSRVRELSYSIMLIASFYPCNQISIQITYFAEHFAVLTIYEHNMRLQTSFVNITRQNGTQYLQRRIVQFIHRLMQSFW